MGRDLFAKGRGRWLAFAASVAVSAAMFYAQSTDAKGNVENAAAPRQPQGSSVLAGAQPQAQPDGQPDGSAPPGAPFVASPAEAESLAANAPVAAPDFKFGLPAGVASENGLQVKTIWAARVIGTMFPEIQTIGGYRQDALPWHPNGLAIDVMIPNPHTEEGIELGNQIAGMALANAHRWGVLHVIWRRGLYPGIGAPSWTADYGSETANHFDHVHIATNGGGYPTGNETYYIGSMSPTPPN